MSRSSPIDPPWSSPLPAIAASSPGASPAVKAEGNNDAEQKAAEKALDEASKKTGIDLPEEGEINKRPFKDLAAHATDLKNRGELDLAQPFEIEIEHGARTSTKQTTPCLSHIEHVLWRKYRTGRRDRDRLPQSSECAIFTPAVPSTLNPALGNQQDPGACR